MTKAAPAQGIGDLKVKGDRATFAVKDIFSSVDEEGFVVAEDVGYGSIEEIAREVMLHLDARFGVKAARMEETGSREGGLYVQFDRPIPEGDYAAFCAFLGVPNDYAPDGEGEADPAEDAPPTQCAVPLGFLARLQGVQGPLLLRAAGVLAEDAATTLDLADSARGPALRITLTQAFLTVDPAGFGTLKAVSVGAPYTASLGVRADGTIATVDDDGREHPLSAPVRAFLSVLGFDAAERNVRRGLGG